VPVAHSAGYASHQTYAHPITEARRLWHECRPNAFVIVLGSSTPLSPVLFDRGVDAVAGTWVVDVAAALRTMSRGATFPQIAGKRLLTMMRIVGEELKEESQ
jgi:hypothetical protein